MTKSSMIGQKSMIYVHSKRLGNQKTVWLAYSQIMNQPNDIYIDSSILQGTILPISYVTFCFDQNIRTLDAN